MRRILQASIAACFAASALVCGAAAQLSVEFDAARPGGDYSVFDVPPPAGGGFGLSWGVCRTACNEQEACRAWTYVYPPLGGGPAPGQCQLKESAPPAAADPCCVAGVKPEGPTMPWGETVYEWDHVRSGDLMREIALQGRDDKPAFCEYLCLVEGDALAGDRCKAWSWEKTDNNMHMCRMFRDESGAALSPGDVSGKVVGR